MIAKYVLLQMTAISGSGVLLIRSAAEPEREEGTRVRFRGTMYQLETGDSTRVECGLYIHAALG